MALSHSKLRVVHFANRTPCEWTEGIRNVRDTMNELNWLGDAQTLRQFSDILASDTQTEM
jgi:hypothetical protein